MTDALANDLRVYAGTRWPTMNHKWRKARLASLLGMNERRVKSLYEAEETARVREDEAARIKTLISAKEEAASAEADKALEARIADLETQLAMVLSALAGDQLAAHGGAARRDSSDAHQAGGATQARRTTDRK